jgi:hypothetical protein
MLNLYTRRSSAKMACDPLPWCTSRSMIAALWMRRQSSSRCRATATSLKMQNPSWRSEGVMCSAGEVHRDTEYQGGFGGLRALVQACNGMASGRQVSAAAPA